LGRAWICRACYGNISIANSEKLLSTQFDILRRTFLFGLISYAASFGGYKLLGLPFEVVDPKKDVTFLNGVFVTEIGVTSLVALVLSILWLYSTNYKLLTRFMQAIRATNRYGDEDVWDFILNADSPSVEYINLRDFDKEITYAGWVETFSEAEKVRELVLRDVKVFNFQGDELFSAPRVYVARPVDTIDIEFPFEPNYQEANP
jgi:hypothetical protein